MRNPLLIAAMALCVSPASAQEVRKPADAAQPATLFVGLAAKVCLASRADPAAVRRLAAANKWPAIAPASLPGNPPQYLYDGKTFTETDAWTLEIAGAPYWIGLFDVPEVPKVRHCSLMAWNQDPEAVDAIFMGGKRDPKDREAAGWKLPVRTYDFPAAKVTYTWSDSGEKRLHVISVVPET